MVVKQNQTKLSLLFLENILFIKIIVSTPVVLFIIGYHNLFKIL